MSKGNPTVLLSVPNLGLGGAQRQTVNIANGLCKKGFRCIIFAFHGGNLSGEIDSKVKLASPCYPTFVRESRLLSTIYGMFSFARTVTKEKPEILYSRHWTKIPNTLFGKIFRIKTVWTEGDSIHFLKRKHPLRFFPHKFCAEHSDFVTAISYGLAEECMKFFNLKSKPTLIYNGVDLELITNNRKQSVKHKWVGSDIFPLVISVGRLTKQKGFEDLIDAFAVLNEKMTVKLLIVGVGDGDLKNVLTEKIEKMGLEDIISLVGYKTNPYPFIAAADVYVSSSIHEGFSGSLLEAQVLGIPTVSTNYPFGTNEIIEDGKSGLLVPVSDPEAMEETIVQTLKNSRLRKRLSQNAREKARRFTLEKTVSGSR